MSLTPFQVVIGTSITPKQPFAQLYQHVRQRDPKLGEAIDRLAAPLSTTDNLANPLQGIEFIFAAATPGAKTNWANVMSNVPTDMTMYFPLIAYGNVTTSSSSDVEIDIQVSHNGGANFVTLLNAPLVIPAGDLVMKAPITTFTQGAYLRNLDLVYAELTSGSFSGGTITMELLFQ